MTNKFFSSVLGSLTRAFVILNSVLMVNAQTQEQQATAACRGSGCAAMSRAELFIKTFASSGNSKGLRTSQLEQEEQVRLAFYGIDATRVEVEAGRLAEQEGNFIIDGHAQVIRNYVHDNAGEAKIRAANGQVSDIPAINKSMGTLLSVARQDALMGREELAQRAQAEIVTVLTTFSQEFANTCDQQSFPVEVALALERQNELMGTGISLTHCMNRKVSAQFSDLGVNYYFESCSGLSQRMLWDMKISGRIVGTGKGSLSLWEANIIYKGSQFDAIGKLKTFLEEIEVKEESVKVPNDAGPNAKPNNRPSAHIPEPTLHPKKVQILKMRMTSAFADYKGEFYGGSGDGKWLEAEIKREDKPCNPATELTFAHSEEMRSLINIIGRNYELNVHLIGGNTHFQKIRRRIKNENHETL